MRLGPTRATVFRAVPALEGRKPDPLYPGHRPWVLGSPPTGRVHTLAIAKFSVLLFTSVEASPHRGFSDRVLPPIRQVVVVFTGTLLTLPVMPPPPGATYSVYYRSVDTHVKVLSVGPLWSHGTDKKSKMYVRVSQHRFPDVHFRLYVKTEPCRLTSVFVVGLSFSTRTNHAKYRCTRCPKAPIDPGQKTSYSALCISSTPLYRLLIDKMLSPFILCNVPIVA